MRKHSEREMHSFPVSGVILKDPVFRHRQELVRKYLAEFDLERLMYSFRKNAGMESSEGDFTGRDCVFRPLYLVEEETYTVYLNSGESTEAKDGSSAYA